MNDKLITAVTTEPVTLAEALAQIRQSTNDLAGNVTLEQSVAPGLHVVDGYEGSSSDIFGYSALLILEAGANGSSGTVDVVIEESDDDTTFTTWSVDSFDRVTEANDNTTYEIAYTGNQRYLRLTATVGTASCSFSCSVLLFAVTSGESTLITDLISMAREYGEDYTGHAFAPQTWTGYLDSFPISDAVPWTRGPLTAISSVKYTNSVNDQTTMTENTDYIVDTDIFPGKIYLPYGKDWASFTPRPYNAVEITGVCGYTGTTPSVLPRNFKQAVLLHIGLLFRYRDEEIPMKAMETVHRLYMLRGVRRV